MLPDRCLLNIRASETDQKQYEDNYNIFVLKLQI